MAKTLKIEDRYSQELTFLDELDATGGATTVVEKINTAYHAKDRVGFVIQNIEYDIHNSDNWYGLFDTAGDRLLFGLCFLAGAPETYGFDADDVGLIDYNSIERLDWGTVASGELLWLPKIKDFSGLRGGGVLVHPSQIYHWIGSPDTLGLAITIVTKIRYFTVSLTEDDYRELWEARAMTSGLQ